MAIPLSGNGIVLHNITASHSGNADEVIVMAVSHSGNAAVMRVCLSGLFGNERDARTRPFSLLPSSPSPKRNLTHMSIVAAPNATNMNVTCIRAGVKDISSSSLVAKAMYIETCMTGNPHFPAPVPSIAELAAKRAELQHWLAEAETGARAAIATRWSVHAELERAIVQLSKYVMAQAQGNVTQQVSSGFELRRPPLKITDLQAPGQLNAKRSDYEGGVQLAWSGVRGARTYQVFVNALGVDSEQGWQLVANTTRSRTEVHQLEPGHYHQFRVRALFAAGDGPFSGVVGCRAA